MGAQVCEFISAQWYLGAWSRIQKSEWSCCGGSALISPKLGYGRVEGYIFFIMLSGLTPNHPRVKEGVIGRRQFSAGPLDAW